MTDARLYRAAPGAVAAAAPLAGPAPARPSVAAPAPETRVLVVGYGNTLRGDDGAGPRAAELVAEDPRLAGIAVVVCHQLTPEIADAMRTASLVVLLDARAGAEPGSVTVELVAGGPEHASSRRAAGDTPHRPPPTDASPSSHHVDPAALAGLARELWGVEPEVRTVSVGAAGFEAGDGLSPAVERALPAVVDAVARVVGEHRRA